MSCDWDVRCVDCGVDAGVGGEPNHEDELMRQIVRHGPALAGLAGLVAEAEREGSRVRDPHLMVSGYRVPLEFFAQHGTHRLRPVDEYGRFDTHCDVVFRCSVCGEDVTCEEQDHSAAPYFGHGHVVGASWHQTKVG